ncbi:MAG: rhodanese-related sulfurtransferase [Cellvibrionaceae bacterium]|jgi:rhodanese-related sulfurtransferase
MPSPTQITVSQLSRLLGTPAAPTVIDVCIDDDFNEDPRLIPTAMRHSFIDIEALVEQLDIKQVVVVCQKGLKLSQGAAALLRLRSIRAESLEGGNFAWRDAGQSLIPVAKIPELNNLSQNMLNNRASSLWVTRQRPKIDRIACPWLIRRFVDPNARFLFVGPSEVKSVAEKFNAIPFDVDGVFWSHREDQCTFDTMIEELALDTDDLKKLAVIIRGADTNNLKSSPQAAGLLAMSLGLSRMYSDDLEQLEAGLIFYDALFRWVRDASREQHIHEVNMGNK